jgi:ElaB/YqjD/DUF883 family membrane-anchored ribosome-binding protein
MFSAATKEAANDTVADAKTTAANAKRDLRSQANDVRSQANSATQEVRSDLVNYAERAGREVRHLIDSASDQFEHVGDRVSSEIKNHPLRSAGVALAFGVLLGALIRR